METRRQFSRLGFAYVIFFVVAVIAQILLTAVTFGLWDNRSEMVAMLVSQASMYCCGFPVFYILMKRIPAWKMIETRKMTADRFLLWLIFCFGLTYLGNFLGQGLMALVGMIAGHPFTSPVESMVMEGKLWLMVISVVLIAPVMEELMFRKFLVDRTIQYGQKTAVIISGVCFGLFHGNFYQFFYACTMGMVFAYLYSSTGKIRYNILLHMIINLVGGVVPVVILKLGENSQVLSAAGSLLLMGLMVGSIVCAIVLFCCYVRHLSFSPGWAELPPNGFWRTVLLSPGAIGFIIMSLVMFVTGTLG